MSEEVIRAVTLLRNNIVSYLRNENESTREVAREVYLSTGNILKMLIKGEEIGE